MTSNTITLLIYCALGVIVIMLAIAFNLIRTVKELEKKVHDIQVADEEAAQQRKMEFVNLDIGIAQMRGSVEVLTTMTSKELNDIQRQLSRIERGISRLQCTAALNGNRLCDLVEWTGMDQNEKPGRPEPPKTCIEYWADKAELADIVDPANLEQPEGYDDGLLDDMTNPVTFDKKENNNEEIAVSYRWIFPSCDERVPEELRRPVIGQWYLVVGTIKGLTKSDGQPMIFTDDGLYNGTDFITTQDQRFDDVFAYIRKPSSTDIMPKVFEMALKERE